MIGVDKSKVKNSKDELKLALEVLHEIILSAKSEKYWIKADDRIYEGNCILLEVMNIQSIGPNLILSPEAATDDGMFNVVYVDEDQRADFAEYIKKRIDQQDVAFNYKSFEAKELTIDCDSAYMHIDDELILPLKNIAVYEVRENVLEFLVPKI